MSYNEVLELPYITFVLGMADAPQIDYDSKKKTKNKANKELNTAQDEINAIKAAFG